MKYVFDYEAPRWAKVAYEIKRLAAINDLTVNIDTDKGWIIEQGIVTLQGSQDDINMFKYYFKQAVEEYNK